MPTDSPASPRPTRVRWIVFTLACAASWLLYIHRYAWGVIKPSFKADNPELTDTELGWLDAAFNATYALGQVPGGMAGDILGPRWVLPAITLAWSAAVAGVAFTGGFWRLIGVRAAFGLAQAGAYPIISKVTRNWFPLSIRTSVQGIVAALGRIGAACSSLILATLLMGVLGLSWQSALVVISVPGVALAFAFWAVLRDKPGDHPLVNAAERHLIEGTSEPGASATGVPAEPPPRKGGLLLTGGSLLALGMMLVYAFASTFQDQLYVNWIPLYLVQEHGMDQTEMGLFTPLPLLGGAVGGVLGGVLNDFLIRRTGNRRWSRTGIAFTGKFIQSGLVVVATQMPTGELAMLMLLTARVFGDWSLPTQWGAITDMGGRAAATLFGLVNTIGAIGGFLAGPILGALKQHLGWDGLFFGVAAMCLLAALTWLAIDCTKKLVED